MKYEFIGNTESIRGVRLRKIRSIITIPNVVVAGQLGGSIESEENLSQDGDSWVFNGSYVWGGARVYDNAQIKSNSRVWDQAQVFGDAVLSGYVWVYQNAKIYGKSLITGGANVYGNSHVYGNAKISAGNVFGEARLSKGCFTHTDTHTTPFDHREETIEFNACGITFSL